MTENLLFAILENTGIDRNKIDCRTAKSREFEQLNASLFALFFSSCCILSLKSDANSITKHQWEPLSWPDLLQSQEIGFQPTGLLFSRIWVVLLASYRISDWKEVSLFERTSDWSFSILSRKALFFCFFHDIPKVVFYCRSWWKCFWLHALQHAECKIM